MTESERPDGRNAEALSAAIEQPQQSNATDAPGDATADSAGFVETLPLSVATSNPALETSSALLAAEGSPPEAPAVSLGRVGRFELRRQLGEGGAGTVYLAYDPTLQREVALKVPKFPLADRQSVERFLREARAASRLRHPNLVAVFECGEAETQCYLVFEYVAGESLLARLNGQSLEPRQAASWTRDLAEALHYAHGEGVVHRDVKPSNVLIEPHGRPLLMDFGVARRVDIDAAMTADGSLLGTPAYMSPEQAEGDREAVGPLSDQYSLGVVLYEMLTGQRPFAGSTYAILGQIIGAEPRGPRALNPAVPRDLEAVCLKALAKRPAERYAHAGELAADLQRWLDGRPVAARPAGTLSRGWQWCQRNRAPVLSTLLLLLVGLFVASWALMARWQNTSEDTHRNAAVSQGFDWPADAPPPALAPFAAEQAQKHQAAWAQHLGVPVELENSIGVRFVLIPPGEFDMGTSEAEVEKLARDALTKKLGGWYFGHLPSEGPQHRVRITQPFWLSRHEVTRGQFRRFVDDRGYQTEAERDGRGGVGLVNGQWVQDSRFVWNADRGLEQADEYPVVNVSWNDVTAFCQWLSEKEGVTCALPTEAQWEYACRAGTTTSWNGGDDETTLPQSVWFKLNSGRTSHPVGQLQPNAWGLYDMHGNVREWCQDWFGEGYYAASLLDDPTGAPEGSLRVSRGGSWNDPDVSCCRASFRIRFDPGVRGDDAGFRLARTVSQNPNRADTRR